MVVVVWCEGGGGVVLWVWVPFHCEIKNSTMGQIVLYLLMAAQLTKVRGIGMCV